MGMIFGEFSSSDWQSTITKLRKDATTYQLNENYELEIDNSHFHDGTIYPVAQWDLRGRYPDELSHSDIYRYLCCDSIGLEYCHGVIFQGRQVGYDLFRPQIEKLKCKIPDYQKFFKFVPVMYILLTEKYSTQCGAFIDMIACGGYNMMIEKAFEKLRENPSERYLICDVAGNLKCVSCRVRRVSETNQKSEPDKLYVKPVYNYYWAANAPS